MEHFGFLIRGSFHQQNLHTDVVLCTEKNSERRAMHFQHNRQYLLQSAIWLP